MAQPESIARKNPAPWTRVYWPAALAIAVAGFLLIDSLDPARRGPALALGAALILVPEITVLLLRRDRDTFSDWVWGVLDVTRNQPMGQWSAEHFLALAAYVVIAVRVCAFLWQHESYWLAGAATATATWLLVHLFFGWWR